jgi:tetratricopeptide (TPR) repeat protein
MKALIVLACVSVMPAFGTLPYLTCTLHAGVAAASIHPETSNEDGDHITTRLNVSRNCTLIYASDDRTALAGTNEDWTNHFNDIWFLPPEKGKFGRVYFGYNFNGERIAQGGMNDQGLFYDGASAETVARPPRDPSLVPPPDDIHLKAMEECSSVEEVLKLYERYHMSVGDGQLMYGDRFGDSVIMEATGNVIRKQGRYQIATNFFQSRIEPKNITDARYLMADNLLRQSKDISVDSFRRILNATHWEEYSESMTVTLYSYICDLKKGDVYIYHFHNFEDVVKMNLHEELRKGERYISILSLFPYDTYAAQRHKAQWTLELLIERARDKGVHGPEGAITLCKEIRRGDFQDYQLSVWEGHLIALGYVLLENDRTEDAIETFKYAVSEHPESANAYASLGEAYWKGKDTKRAIENYRKSLELDPEDDNARDMLQRLEATTE